MVWNDAIVLYDMKWSKHTLWYENDVTAPYAMK